MAAITLVYATIIEAAQGAAGQYVGYGLSVLPLADGRIQVPEFVAAFLITQYGLVDQPGGEDLSGVDIRDELEIAPVADLRMWLAACGDATDDSTEETTLRARALELYDDGQGPQL